MRDVIFVCWGNICRSPMAERVAERWLRDAGVRDIALSSAATSTEEIGAPIDPRAVTTLSAAGYRTTDHRAHQITREEIAEADLVVAMEQIHLDKMAAIYGGELPSSVMLLSDFAPEASPGDGVPDPWYGGQRGFEDTLEMIERSMPGLVERIGNT